MYEFMTTTYRAQCLNVVDGDTVDLLVDKGMQEFSYHRVRLYGIDTAEMNSKDLIQKDLAKQAKNFVIECLKPSLVIGIKRWPLKIESYKDPDNFGRWLVNLYYEDTNGVEKELNSELVSLGLAIVYKR